MSLFYALIAKSFDIVLCEYTDYSGNFQQISRMLLRKIQKNTKLTVNYDKYKFHYINDNDITYLCLSENYDDDIAFAFLKDLKKILLSKYDYEKIASFCAYQLNDFDKNLSQLINYYNSNPTITKTGDVISELHEAKNAQIENIEQIFERDQKLNIIAIKSESLYNQSKNINLMAMEISKQKRRKQMKIVLIMIGVLFLLFLIYYSFGGGKQQEPIIEDK